jgi:translation elongation factor EF-G
MTPVLCGAAFRNKGVQPLLDGIVDYLPSPMDVPAITGMATGTAEPVSRHASDDAPCAALAFKMMVDPYVGQLVFVRVYSGILAAGSAVYNPVRGRRERIGRLVRMHANSGVIPKEYMPAIQAGVVEAMQHSIVAGCPVVDIQMPVYDGSYHEVDSSELAFKIAASMAFKEIARKAEPFLLEPIMDVEVVVSDTYMGDVLGDLNNRRGKICGLAEQAGARVVYAHVPLAEMFGYATALRSRIQGRATFTMQFASYDEVPARKYAAIIASEHIASG